MNLNAFHANPSAKKLALPVALILLSIAFLIVSILNITALSGIADALNAERVFADSNDSQISSLLELSRDEYQTQQTLESYRRLLTSGENQNEIFTRIQTLSEKYSIGVLQIRFQSVQPADELKKIPLELTLTGDYPQIMAMLEEFSQDGRLSTLDSLSLSVQDEKGAQIRADAVTSVFFE